MQTIRKKTSPLKYRNEPGRFFGDGVSFKAKLIGILEVGEARGDRMCQEALQDLKMAIRAAGEHKQRITIHVTIDGLRLRDEKTGDSLYHHPVHKISFIAQDMTDSRAFGYIFGSPDSGHRFFGIKTDKAASQVVLAMRDLFQVVFELKKKEIELARQHIQSKITAHEHQAVSASLVAKSGGSTLDSSGGGGGAGGSSSSYGKNHSSETALGALAAVGSSMGAGSSGAMKMVAGKSEKSPESVADLVDLEQELSCIQRGITQMERITPSEGPGKSVLDDDPFGDSFANIPPSYNLLPPPESSKRHQKQTHRSTENLPTMESSPNVSSTPPPMPAPPIPTQPSAGAAAGGGATTLTGSSSSQPSGGTSNSNNNTSNSNNPPPSQGAAGGSTLTSSNSVQNDDWLNSPPNTSRFDPEPARYSDEPKNPEDTGKTPQTSAAAQPSSYTDVFTDLDPLGTGKIKPYIDKKFFFQELKNPPKKVLKDLSGKESTFNANFASEDGLLQQSVGGSASLNASNISTLASGSGDLFKASFDEAQSSLKNANSSAEAGSSGAGDGGGQAGGGAGTGMPLIESLVGGGSSAPADPFMEDDDFSKLQLDPFEVHFSRNASPRNAGGQQEGGRPSDSEEPSNNKPTTEAKDGTVYNGPLQVNLPPESWASYISQKRLERQSSEASAAAQTGQTGGPNAHRNRPAASSVFKQNTVDVISSLSSSSKKMKPNLFGQKFSKRDSNSINMRRLQESDSLSETEMAPEPPPRPDSGSHIEPPPLPPKKQFADIVIRPSPRSSSSSSSHANAGGAGSGSLSGHGPRERYDYVGSKYDSSRPPSGGDRAGSDAPPLPLPSRKVGRTAGETVGPGRPQKKCTDEDDYLAPIGKIDIPTLLPPPQRKDASKTTRTTRKQSETDPRNLDEPTPPPSSKSPTGSGAGHFAKELDQHHHQQQQQSVTASSFLPDITLSQLLTLGIDELAAKLNVPVSKLSTMTLVELTTYLSEFIENSKYPTAPAPAPPPSAAPSWATSSSISQDNTAGRDGSVSESPVFKVNFDDSNDAMFVAKFDDNFGEDERPARGPDRTSTFVANFDHLNLQPTGGSGSHPSSAPVVDKYAVFREIIEQEIGPEGAGSVDAAPEQDQEQRTGPNDRSDSLDLQKEVASEMNRLSPAFMGGETANVGSSPLPMHSFGGSSASPLTTGPPLTKIDTKITEVISQAKDRYAALRDIILVEDLFEKPAAPMARMESSSFEDRELDDDAKFEANFDDMEPAVVQQQQQENTSPEINISDADMNEDEMQQQRQLETGQDGGVAFRGAVTPREDLEIDELMQKAVSNLSLHSNEQLSPAPTGSASTQLGQGLKGSPLLQHSATSPYRPTNMSTSTTLLNDMIGPKAKSPTTSSTMVQYETLSLGPSGRSGGGGLSDMSTSPIPPLGPKSSSSSGTGMAKSPILKPSPMSRRSDEGGRGKPTPAPRGQSSSDKRSSGSMSDGDGESSPEGDNNEEGKLSRMTPTNANESWAVFDQPEPPLHHPSKRQDMRPDTVRGDSGRRSGDKNGPDSPCSSDPKDEWTKADLRDYNRRWPSKGHTSSSSRDVSPWDEEGPDYRKRSSMHPSGGGGDPSMRHHHPTSGERYHHPRMPPRRINSNDEDYDEELVKERGQQRRRMKSGVGSRSRDNFEDEHWYHDHHAGPTWSSPTEDEDVRGPPGERGERGSRSFDRNAYERSTYGPPYEKREPKSLPPAYDRREYGKGYDKRKYYREREPSRGGSGGRYDYDPYGGDGGYGGRRGADYDEGVVYERPSRDSRAAREYFYERERKSFDRESNESYDSRERQRSFGSGDIYGSLDSRAEYRERDRYLSLDKSRSLRRGMRNAGSARLDQELDQDSEGDLIGGMMGGSGRSGGGLRDAGGNSLHRSSQNIGRGGGGGGSKQQQQQQMMMMLDDDVWGVTKGGGGVGSAATMPWKRPSSATEQQEQRRYNEAGGRSGRGMGPVVGGTSLAGSDGEKDRRFRKKSRSRADRKEMEMRTNYATMRYPVRSKEDYFDFDAPEGGRVGAGVDDDDDEDDEDEVPAGKLTLLDDPLDEGPAYYGPGRRVPPGGPLPPGVGGAYYGKSSTPRQEGRSLNDALIAQEAKKMARYEYEEEALRRMKKSNSRDLYFEGGSGGGGGGGSGYGSVTPPKSAAQKQHSVAPAGRTPLDFEFEEYADPAGPPAGGDGFESDFNSPPTGGTGGGGPGGAGGRSDVPKSYRFSSDFSNEKERAHYAHDPPPPGGYHRPQQHYKAHASSGAGYADTGDYPQQAPASSSATPPPGHHHQHHQHHREQTAAVGSGSKLRFNENVTVSKFDAEATTMFEDDFAGRSDAEQDPDDGQQQQQQGWSTARITTSPGPAAAPATSNNGSNKKILKTSSQAGHHQQQHQQHQQQQLFNQDNIRKSDSINIFAKKVDDPFEDDDFFASSGGGGRGDPFGGSGAGNGADAAHHGGGATATGAGAGGWDKNFANFDDNI